MVITRLAACGSDVSSPVAPTPPPVQPPPVILFPVTFPFDSWLWQSLVYNAYDDHPGDLSESGRVSWVFDLDRIPHFYIRRSTPDDTMPGCGRRWPLDHLAYMERMIPRLVEQLTGERYRGQIISGCEDRHETGWITIVSATPKEEPDLAGYCGLARIGSNPGRIWFNEEPAYTCTRAGFRELLAHELGHAMGFYHAPSGREYAMAYGEWTGREGFTIAERQHAQYAYKRGRHAPYCYDAATCGR